MTEILTLAAFGLALSALSDIAAHGGFAWGIAAFVILVHLVHCLPEAPGPGD
jgi:hypothetical protein